VIHEIAQDLHQINWKSLTAEAQRKLQLCLLANISVAVAGGPAMRLPRPKSGLGHLLIDGGQTSSAREAAFYNAALMHARTQDDFHPYGNNHVTTIILPALLAEAERCEVSGEELLSALAVGYATSAGLSRATSASTTPRGLRSTCLFSTMGAAAAVSSLRGQGSAGIANTLSLASQSAFGTTQCWRDGSDEYQLHVANAASQALLCAELTEAGVVGGAHALDGPSGFYSVLTGAIPTYEKLRGDFEPNASILDTVLKRYPVSGICQPVTLLSERLAAELGSKEVASVLIEMNAFEMSYPGTLNAGPDYKSFSDRLMSARFCAGSVLENGRFDFTAFLRPQSDGLSRLMAATDVRAADDLKTLSCRITLTMRDGSTLRGELRDGGKELAIDWDTIDAWSLELWRGAGRTAGELQTLRAAVMGLPNTGFDALRLALLHNALT